MIFAALFLFLSQQVASQAPSVPFPFNSIESELALPADGDSWTVEVVTRGGLDGRGMGDYRLTSLGKFSTSFRDITRDKNIEKNALENFKAFIPLSVKVAWGHSSLGTCMDCIANLVRLRIRESGQTKTYLAYWDVTTQRRVPEEVVRLFNAVIALGKYKRSE